MKKVFVGENIFFLVKTCFLVKIRRYGLLRGPNSSSCGGHRLSAYYAVLAHLSPFLKFSSNLVNWMSVRTQFGHGRTCLSVCAHFGYRLTNLKKSQKITIKIYWRRKKFSRKKCYRLSFPILGGRNLTRDLQFIPFQNPGGGVPWAWQTNDRRT